MIHTINKPPLTSYSDFNFYNGHLYAIFETKDGRQHNVKVCKTDITNETWIIRDTAGNIKGFKGEIKETETQYMITLNN